MFSRCMGLKFVQSRKIRELFASLALSKFRRNRNILTLLRSLFSTFTYVSNQLLVQNLRLVALEKYGSGVQLLWSAIFFLAFCFWTGNLQTQAKNQEIFFSNFVAYRNFFLDFIWSKKTGHVIERSLEKLVFVKTMSHFCFNPNIRLPTGEKRQVKCAKVLIKESSAT